MVTGMKFRTRQGLYRPIARGGVLIRAGRGSHSHESGSRRAVADSVDHARTKGQGACCRRLS
jgi:hypothetical protein